MIKIKTKSPPKNILDRSIISHSRSREKSSSGDDKKSNSSLKKKLYKHVIFDKRLQPSNFKTLHRIRQQALQQQDIKWKSTEELSLKDKIIGIIENQALKNNKIRKNIESYELIPSIKTQEYIPSHKISQQKYQEDKQTQKNTQTFQNTRVEQVIIAHIKMGTENRDLQILRRKQESNIKFLRSQTSQLLSFTKFMLLEAEIDETKKIMSQLSIYLREMRINMRSNEFTKQINFTFPVKRHNDQITVKMPEQVAKYEMTRYLKVEQRLKHENQIFQVQQQKFNNLTKYYLSLLKKFDPIIDSKQILSKNESPKKTTFEEPKNKLNKAKSSEYISIKNKNNFESFCTSNSGSSNRKSSTKLQLNNIKTQKNLSQNRFFTLRQKKQALIDSIDKLKSANQSKTKRLTEQINLLKRQIYFFNENIQQTHQKKSQIISEIEHLRKKKLQIADQNRQNSEKYFQSIENMTAERKLNFLKQRYKRNLQDKGFTNNLRQNKSLSPLNYLSNTSRNFLASYSPRCQK